MIDLTKEVTVFVIAVEKQKNYQACLKALRKQTCKFTLEKVLDYAPMSKAFNQMLVKCKTPYFIQCDEDMILYPDTVRLMYQAIKKTTPQTGILLFHLKDVHLKKTIRGVRIYRTNIAKKYPFQDTLACENTQKIQMKKEGTLTKVDNRIVGKHSPYWTTYTIFQRYFNFMERHKLHKRHKEIPQELWETLKQSPNELNLYALLGAFSSLFNNKVQDKEKHFYTDFYNAQFQIIKNILESSNPDIPSNIHKHLQFICPDYKHPYLRELSKYIDIELEQDLDKVRNSHKALIIWNPYSYIKVPRLKWKLDIYNYFKDNNKPAYIVERGALPETIYIDKSGFLFDSESYNKEKWDVTLTGKDYKLIADYIENFINQTDTLEPQQNGFVSKETFYNELELDGNIIKVFVPLQVHDDTVILLWCDWVKSMPKFQSMVRKLGKKMENVIFLVKNHPVESKKMRNGQNIKIVDNYHYKDCIKYSDIVLTINSGVGLQAMMWKKPVIIVGNAFYQQDEVNQKANNIKEVQDYILNPMTPNNLKTRKFLYYLKFKYYTECIMKSIGVGRSTITEVKKIRFEAPESFLNITVDPQDHKLENTFIEFLTIVPDCCLLKETCLDAVKMNALRSETSNIYIGLKELTDELINTLAGKDFIFNADTNEFVKNNITINIETMPANTKSKVIYNCETLVPLPVIGYLETLYGQKWRD